MKLSALESLWGRGVSMASVTSSSAQWELELGYGGRGLEDG